jgi:AraC-type DNA-binding domain-containing proteins
MERYNEPYRYDGNSYGIVLSGHYQVDDTYATSRPEGREDCLIAFTLSGKGYFKTPHGTAECTAGDLALLKPGTPHTYGTVKEENWNFVWAHFSPSSVGDQLLPTEPLLVQPFESGSIRTRLHEAFRRILSDSRERNEFWHELCVNSLREVLILLSQRRSRKLDSRVEEALHYLSVHMRNPIQIDRLAKSIGISSSRLSHLFKEQTGLSIIDNLNRMRIRQAALLLEHTNRSASEVAYDVGFHNYNHFIEQFRRWIGTNPSGFRRELQSKPSPT